MDDVEFGSSVFPMLADEGCTSGKKDDALG
jgi:hypothetical protein